MHEDEDGDGEDIPSPMDMGNSVEESSVVEPSVPSGDAAPAPGHAKKKSLGSAARGAIFREVVLAKVREQKEAEEREKIEREAREKAAAA